VSSLYLRIYATLVVVLLLFASASGWLFQRHLEQERGRADSVLTERMGAWAELIQRSLPGTEAPTEDQAAALRDWSQRLRLPLALDSAAGQRIASSESFLRRQPEGAPMRGLAVHLEDGRTLWIMRPGQRRPGALGAGAAPAAIGIGSGSGASDAPPGPRFAPNAAPPFLPFVPPAWQQGIGLVILLVLLFVAVAAGAFPVVRRLTRRLEALKQGVEQFGAGQLNHRVAVSGHDEVAAVATSFNVAAARVEALVQSHQSLLANASHELRSPLARMKLAVALLDDAPPAQRDRLKREIDTNVAELDALVEEVLLASRLDAAPQTDLDEAVDLLGMAAEEGARVGARVGAQVGAQVGARVGARVGDAADGSPLTVTGDERLLRRALRNLLENARRYGGDEIEVEVQQRAGLALLRVCDRGPGVPAAMRERIFEPFFRMPGHAEQAGGVGLGLSLVRQIALRHGGSVRCDARAGGGSCFEVCLPLRR
jgi:signal transduction histidine kinase